jgi:hypothetical protein
VGGGGPQGRRQGGDFLPKHRLLDGVNKGESYMHPDSRGNNSL